MDSLAATAGSGVGQIEQGLDDRFGLLVRGPRGVAARQRTLAASLAWSHDVLDQPDRAVFRRLAVFPAGFDLDAARAVCSGGTVERRDVLGIIGRLVDKSLVVAENRGGVFRYLLLETIREYAADRLRDAAETAATRDRHLDYFLAFATGGLERAADLDAWRTRLEGEYDNSGPPWRGDWPPPIRTGAAAWPPSCPGCGTCTGTGPRASTSCGARSTGHRRTARGYRPGCSPGWRWSPTPPARSTWSTTWHSRRSSWPAMTKACALSAFRCPPSASSTPTSPRRGSAASRRSAAPRLRVTRCSGPPRGRCRA